MTAFSRLALLSIALAGLAAGAAAQTGTRIYDPHPDGFEPDTAWTVTDDTFDYQVEGAYTVRGQARRAQLRISCYKGAPTAGLRLSGFLVGNSEEVSGIVGQAVPPQAGETRAFATPIAVGGAPGTDAFAIAGGGRRMVRRGVQLPLGLAFLNHPDLDGDGHQEDVYSTAGMLRVTEWTPTSLRAEVSHQLTIQPEADRASRGTGPGLRQGTSSVQLDFRWSKPILCKTAEPAAEATVAEACPATQDEGAPLDTPVRVTFDRAVEPSTLREGDTFTVKVRGGAPASGTLAAESPTVAVWTPSEPLHDGVVYDVVLRFDGTDGIRPLGERSGQGVGATVTATSFATRISAASFVDLGAAVHTYQTIRTTRLIPGKPAAIRVRADWTPNPNVDAGSTVDSYLARVSAYDVNSQQSLAIERVERVRHQNDYSLEELRLGLNTIDLLGWRPARNTDVQVLVEQPPPSCLNRPAPSGPLAQRCRADGVWCPPAVPTIELRSAPERLTITYRALTLDDTGDEMDGIHTFSDRDREVMAWTVRTAERYATQLFPVRIVTSHDRGPATISTATALRLCHGSSNATPDFLGGLPKENSDVRCRNNIMRFFGDRYARADEVTVAFLPETTSWIGPEFSPLYSTFTGGQTYRPRSAGWGHRPHVVRYHLDAVQSGKTGLVHELGHVYGLDHVPYVANKADRRDLLDTERATALRRQPDIDGYRMSLDGRRGWAKSSTYGNAQDPHVMRTMMWPGSLWLREAFIQTSEFKHLSQTMRRDDPGLSARWTGPLFAAAAPPLPAEALLVSGLLLPDGTATLFPVERLDAPPPPAPEADGELVVEALVGERVVASATESVGDANAAAYFGAVLVTEAQPDAVRVRRGDAILARVEAGAPPEARLDVADGAELSGGDIVTWERSEGALSTVSYSPDGAAPWTVLVAATDATRLRLADGHLSHGPRPTLRLAARRGLDDAVVTARIRVSDALSLTWATDMDEPLAPVDGVELWFGAELDGVPDEVRLVADGAETARDVSAVGRWLIVRPRAPLPAGAALDVVVDGVRSTDGATLPAPLRLSYTVAGMPDATPSDAGAPDAARPANDTPSPPDSGSGTLTFTPEGAAARAVGVRVPGPTDDVLIGRAVAAAIDAGLAPTDLFVLLPEDDALAPIVFVITGGDASSFDVEAVRAADGFTLLSLVAARNASTAAVAVDPGGNVITLRDLPLPGGLVTGRVHIDAE